MLNQPINAAIVEAVLAGAAPGTPGKPKSKFTSRQRNRYCACGKRDDAGRLLKFKHCCGKEQ